MVIIMFKFFLNTNPIIQSFIAGIFTFSITMLGSAIVFLFKKINKTIMDIMLSISAGIMISTSFFSLLLPAINSLNLKNISSTFFISFSFIFGSIILALGDKIVTKLSNNMTGDINNLKSCIMLFFSITLHNIPEGLVIGVAFASYAYLGDITNITSAIVLTIGIAIQNFPEGAAISLPFRRSGFSIKKSFVFGALSAIVEPIFACIGALLILKIQNILPFIMSFTAGAMIFVTVLELIPESQNNKRKDLMGLFFIIGFVIMMILELLLD